MLSVVPYGSSGTVSVINPAEGANDVIATIAKDQNEIRKIRSVQIMFEVYQMCVLHMVRRNNHRRSMRYFLFLFLCLMSAELIAQR